MFRNLFPIFYETPGGSAPGGAPTPTPQPGAPGQGQGQGAGFRQTFFPNVPDDQWATIEPHVQGINQHVTQMEQRYAPFKGYTPEAVQGLAEFSAAFDRDPLGQWIRLAQVLQMQGRIDPDLDLEHLAKSAAGQWDDDEDEPAPGGPLLPGQQPDPRDTQIKELQAQVQQLVQMFTQDKQTSRQRVEDAALNRQLAHLKSELVKAGYPEEALSQESLLSSYIAHRGNVANAITAATNQRNAILQGFTADPASRQQQQKDKNLDLPNGTPPVPKERQSASRGRRRGMFADVEAAAEQALAAADRS